MTTLYAAINGLLWVDSGIQPVLQGLLLDAESPAQFGQRDALSVPIDNSVDAHVVLLLQPRRPTAIPRLVTAFVIDAIKRVARRARTHVGQECAEVVQPTLAYAYTSSAIAWKGVVLRVVATRLCRLPRQIFTALRRRVPAISVGGVVACGLALKATTTTSQRSQLITSDCCFATAVATAQPVSATPSYLTRCFSEHYEATKSVADEMYELRHARHYRMACARVKVGGQSLADALREQGHGR